jgi:hypothetical protein
MSSNALAAWVRRTVLSRVLPRVIGARGLRARAFRFVSELEIHYYDSAAVAEGSPAPAQGPRAGDRLPDAAVTVAGRATTLQRELMGPCLQLLLCGDAGAWRAQEERIARLASRYGHVLRVRRLAREPAPGVLVDDSGEALARLGVGEHGGYVVRPDGYVAYRCAGTGLLDTAEFLGRTLA